jgi:hypothetical protein
MIEFGILGLSCLLNKFAGLTEEEKSGHGETSNQIELIYGSFLLNASGKSHAAPSKERIAGPMPMACIGQVSSEVT